MEGCELRWWLALYWRWFLWAVGLSVDRLRIVTREHWIEGGIPVKEGNILKIEVEALNKFGRKLAAPEDLVIALDPKDAATLVQDGATATISDARSEFTVSAAAGAASVSLPVAFEPNNVVAALRISATEVPVAVDPAPAPTEVPVT